MTPERIAELRALCAAATPGPWYVNRIKGYPTPDRDDGRHIRRPEALGSRGGYNGLGRRRREPAEVRA